MARLQNLRDGVRKGSAKIPLCSNHRKRHGFQGWSLKTFGQFQAQNLSRWSRGSRFSSLLAMRSAMSVSEARVISDPSGERRNWQKQAKGNVQVREMTRAAAAILAVCYFDGRRGSLEAQELKQSSGKIYSWDDWMSRREYQTTRWQRLRRRGIRARRVTVVRSLWEAWPT